MSKRVCGRSAPNSTRMTCCCGTKPLGTGLRAGVCDYVEPRSFDVLAAVHTSDDHCSFRAAFSFGFRRL